MKGVSRADQLRSQAIHACFNAITGNQALIMSDGGARTNLYSESEIHQDTVWRESDKEVTYRIRVIVELITDEKPIEWPGGRP